MMKRTDLLYIQFLTVWSLNARGTLIYSLNKEGRKVGNPGKFLKLGEGGGDNNLK